MKMKSPTLLAIYLIFEGVKWHDTPYTFVKIRSTNIPTELVHWLWVINGTLLLCFQERIDIHKPWQRNRAPLGIKLTKWCVSQQYSPPFWSCAVKPDTPNLSGFVPAASKKVSGDSPPACGLFCGDNGWNPLLWALSYASVTLLGRFGLLYRVHDLLPLSPGMKVCFQTQLLQLVGSSKHLAAQSQAVLNPFLK